MGGMQNSDFQSFTLEVSPETESVTHHDHEHEDFKDSENVHVGTKSGLVLGLVSLTLAIVVSWAVSTAFPYFDVGLAQMAVGILFGFWQDTQWLIESADSDFMRYVSPPTMLMPMLETNVHLAMLLLPQYLTMALAGTIFTTVGNASAVYWLQYLGAPELKLTAIICIGAVLTHPNIKPVRQILLWAGIGGKFLVLVRGEVNFANLIPNLILDIGQSHMGISDDHTNSDVVQKLSHHWVDFAMVFTASTVATVACGIGVGILFLWAIELMSNRFSHLDRQLQVVLTVLCSYAAFHSAFRGVGRNGQISVVAAGWILAWRMWPSIIDKNEMKAFWRVVNFFADSFGNFILGAIISGTMTKASLRLMGARPDDPLTAQQQMAAAAHISVEGSSGLDTLVAKLHIFGHIVLLWLAVTLVRMVVFVAFKPVTNSFGKELKWSEHLLWAWVGTVKGRMGTIITIFRGLQVLQNTQSNPDRRLYGELLLLYGAGVTFLSILLNGPLTHLVIKALGINSEHSIVGKMRSGLAARIIRHRVEEIATETGSLQLKVACPHLHEHLKSHEDLVELSVAELETYKSCLRGLVFKLLEKEYLKACEGKSSKVVHLITNILLESIRHGKENVTLKLKDWEHIVGNLPKRKAEVVFVMLLYVKCHRAAQFITDDQVLSGLQNDNDFFSRGWETAWDSVRSESNRNCRKARETLAALEDLTVRESFETMSAVDLCNSVEAQVMFLQESGLVDDVHKVMHAIESDLTSLDKVKRGSEDEVHEGFEKRTIAQAFSLDHLPSESDHDDKASEKQPFFESAAINRKSYEKGV